jgi:chromate reductase
VTHELVVLSDASRDAVEAALWRADRVVFVTGTYWGGFSSLLQRLFEELTPAEGGALWLGKPVAALVTAHQVGGQAVLWRLQGIASSWGCLVPPMSGVVITKVTEHLRERAPQLCHDTWGLEDIDTALHNLLAAPRQTSQYQAWEVDREHYAERWLQPPVQLSIPMPLPPESVPLTVAALGAAEATALALAGCNASEAPRLEA